MLRISTPWLAFVPSKFYQFNKPAHTADVARGSVHMTFILYGTPTKSKSTYG